MRKLLTYSIIIFFILSSCSGIRELISFTKCEFRLYHIEQIILAGINLEGKSSINDFKIADVAVFSQCALKGTLPLDMIIQIEAKNPNHQYAAINRVEWIAYLDDIEMINGYIDDRVVIPPDNGVGIVPIHIQFDLNKAVKSSAGIAIANLAMNMMNIGGKESRLAIKIKPTILVGSFALNYPGYIKLTKEFTSGN